MSQDIQHPELKAFPSAKTGIQRLVINLPDKTREESQNVKVELIPGKTMLTDGVNNYRTGMSIKAKTLSGWGYSFYEVEGTDSAMNTLIGVPAGTEEVSKFVEGRSILIDYNSRLPIVIYAPEGFEVQYKIWQADKQKQIVKQG